MAEKTKAKSTKAEGTYGIQGWDEKTWDGKEHKDVHGAKLTLAIIKQDYHGDFEGDVDSQLLMNYLDDNHISYVGYQKMVGRLGERTGSFVAHVEGSFEQGAATSIFTIIPGSGTGDLSGIEGKGESVSKHGDTQPYSLTYSFK